MVRVMKFGGVALQDADAMRRVAKIIKHEPGRKIVVASAMKGVTDAIARGLEPIRKNEARVPVLMDRLKTQHRATAHALRRVEPRDEALYAVDKVLDRLERLLFGIAYTEEITPRSRDLALSFGERLSVRLLAGYLQEQGVRAVAHDADRLGVATNGHFGFASPDLAATTRNLRRSVVHRLDRTLPVITGFFGADRQGHTTVFGRGGSDFSAAIISHAVGAEVLEIWKETPGFMTADPRLVPKARRIDEMSYEEAAELANFGAKILHPRTVEPVSLKRIPIRIRELQNPRGKGTLIRDYRHAPSCFIRSVAARKELSILRLLGPGMGYTPGVAHDVFKVLKEQSINVINMSASEASFALLIDTGDAKTALASLRAIRGGVIQDVVLENGMALVSVVGKGLGDRIGSAAQILASVSRADVNIHMISLGASEIAINFVIRAPDAEAALRAVHKTFLENGAKRP